VQLAWGWPQVNKFVHGKPIFGAPGDKQAAILPARCNSTPHPVSRRHPRCCASHAIDCRETRGEIAFKDGGAQMPNDNHSDHPQSQEDALKNFALLALPWLSLQRQMLEILIKGMKDSGNVKPIENFTLSELQALAMILDPSRTSRNRVDPDLEKRLQDTLKEVVPKITSASVQALQAQQSILSCMFDALQELRKGDKGGGRPTGKAAN
jgi:hypothetical protein